MDGKFFTEYMREAWAIRRFPNEKRGDSLSGQCIWSQAECPIGRTFAGNQHGNRKLPAELYRKSLAGRSIYYLQD